MHVVVDDRSKDIAAVEGSPGTRATFVVAPLRRHRPVVVFGRHAGSDLVFIGEDDALRLAALHRALVECRTWGELRARLTPEDFVQAMRQRSDAPYDEITFEPLPPSDEEPFEASSLVWLAEGNWPRPPVVEQLDWLPQDVLSLGDRWSGGMTGESWMSFREDIIAEAAARLADHGYRVRRDDALCIAATGG